MTGQYIIDLFLEGLPICGHLVGDMITSGYSALAQSAGF